MIYFDVMSFVDLRLLKGVFCVVGYFFVWYCSFCFMFVVCIDGVL